MDRQRTVLLVLLLLIIIALAAGAAAAQEPVGTEPTSIGPAAASAAVGTGFTYQGRLNDGGSPANGAYDFQFLLYDAASGGAQIGSTVTKSDVAVSNGLFTATLDFGDTAFQGDARWLAIRVRPGASGGSYTGLNPRQALTATPYALGLRPGAVITGTASTALTLAGGSVGLDASGETYGVYGWSASSGGRGVYGNVSAGSGNAVGVWGQSASTDGRGVTGWATADSGETRGVYGRSNSTDGRGMYGYASAGSGTNYGVYGQSDSINGYGVYGLANAGSGNTFGLYGKSVSTTGTGVVGYANASSGETIGVFGRSNSPDGAGVKGIVTANSGIPVGVLGQAPIHGYAGEFLGRVYVSSHVLINGDLTVVGSKAFKIDHPSDPANRYLYHFSQEAPEVQNVYNGVVILDADGQVAVTLPAYFAAINTGAFRYQLTAIGAPMPNLHIARKIEGNTFHIAGGAPGMEVSWEVTAVRNDPYLRDHAVQAEVDKPAEEQGIYLYPQGYGQPTELGLDYRRSAQFDRTAAGDGE